jgi:hypothetical protein
MLIANPLNEFSLAFPILECFHILGFVCGVGTIALVDFRLLGVGLTRKSAAQLWSATMPWTLSGLTLAIFSGLLLFSIDPDMYYLNYIFLFKMLSLALAILFYYTMVHRVAASGSSGSWSRMVACISLGLWAMVLFGGIFIGFINSATEFFSHIRDLANAYPIILSLHMVALALFGGMIVVTDLRLLGLGMRGYSVSEVVNGLRAPKRFGFVFAAVCGVLMFGAKAELYPHSPWFWTKIALLVAIAGNYLIFRRSVYLNSAELDRSPRIPGRARLAGGLSLLLWTGVACAGRGPATIKDIMHSVVNPSGEFVFQSVQEIADEHGIREKAPKTDAEWEDVRDRLMILLDAPKLLTAEGRMAARPRDRSKNPQVENEPAEVQKLLDSDRSGFIRRAARLHDAAAVAIKAVDAKDTAALFRALDGIDKACESCHLHYWYPNDKRAQEAAREDGLVE